MEFALGRAHSRAQHGVEIGERPLDEDGAGERDQIRARSVVVATEEGERRAVGGETSPMYSQSLCDRSKLDVATRFRIPRLQELVASGHDAMRVHDAAEVQTCGEGRRS